MNDSLEYPYYSDVLCNALRDKKALSFFKKLLTFSYLNYYIGYESEVTKLINAALELLLKSQLNTIDNVALQKAVKVIHEKIFIQDETEWFRSLYREYKIVKRPQEDFSRVKKYINGSSVLDVGAGPCYFSYELLRHGYDVLATDIIDYRNGTRKVVDFYQMKSPDDLTGVFRKFDTAFLKTVLHHVSGDDTKKLLHQVKHKANRIIIEEDVTGIDEINNKGNSTELYLQRYASLTIEQQKNVLILMDFFGNIIVYGINNMNMPYQFKSIQQWKNILSECGLSVKEVVVIGFDKTRVHRPCQAWFICDTI